MLMKTSKPRSVFCTLAASAALLMVPNMPSFAAPQIGVTAALREVVRTTSLENGAAIGQMSSAKRCIWGTTSKSVRKAACGHASR